jgi:hypothetical protein
MEGKRVLFVGGIICTSLGVLGAIVAKKPIAFALGICGGLILFVLSKRALSTSVLERAPFPPKIADIKKEEQEQEQEMALGAGSSSTPDGGPAKLHTQQTKPDPTLYPVPFRVKHRLFWEDPMDDRMRWHVSGNQGPYTAWRGVNGIW